MNSKNESSCSSSPRRGMVGGQAIIEGVMMRGKEYSATSVRRLDNKKIAVTRKPNKSISDKYTFLKWPLLRGVVNFIEMMILSFSTITEGTEMLGLDAETEEESSKFDRWLEEHCGKWIIPVISVISLVLGVGLAVLLFIWLPTFIGNLFFGSHSHGFGAGAGRSVVEGVLKIVIFIAYIWLTAFIPDMKRVYMYHGAEHKSIFCFEAEEELTVENVRKQSRFHPRCGTSFMFAMILLSIFVGIAFLWWVKTVWLRSLLKLVLLPLTVGIGYEFIRYAGKHDNALIRALSAPGLWMQRITTKEPDDDMIEVAVTSLKCALPDVFPGYYEELKSAEEAEDSPEEATEEALSDGASRETEATE